MFLGTAANALAQDVTINLTAQVESVDDPNGVLGGAINPGDSITGSYTYSLATPDSNDLSTVGDYWHTGPAYGITVNAGGLMFASDPANVSFLVELVNDHGTPASDNYLLRSYNNLPLASGAPVGHIAWQLDDPSLIALSDTNLSAAPPELGNWQSLVGLTLEGSFDDPQRFYFVRAHVTSVTGEGGPSPDADSDGVLDAVDICPGTQIPEATYAVALRPQHFVLLNEDAVFDAVASQRRFTLADTKGCSCEQILALKPGANKGSEKFGCPLGIIQQFIDAHR